MSVITAQTKILVHWSNSTSQTIKFIKCENGLFKSNEHEIDTDSDSIKILKKTIDSTVLPGIWEGCCQLFALNVF